MRLFLIRHGQTPNNVLGRLDTAAPGAGLTPLGHAQARALADALLDEKLAGVHASPLTRARLTATPLARSRSLDVVVRPGLEEISAGSLEMRNDEEAVHHYVSCVAAWMHGDLDVAMPGGQDGHTFVRRFDAALAGLLAEHGSSDDVAVVSHGAAIRVWTTLRTGIDTGTATSMSIMNTGMAVLDGHPDLGWDLVEWRTEPVGGLALEDPAAHDVTGESTDDAAET